mmetsp:Transcript_18694/g.43388  ORF Transcript_18694/g.43388 Transcript_18694/m.43388 type:complete len:232 (-) Transcript_18694:1794-2489(-)
MSPDPYEHLPPSNGQGNERTTRHVPTGCVGAYLRAVRTARMKVAMKIKQERKARFEALSAEQQREISVSFLEACSSDDSLPLVREMIHIRDVVDVDGFLVGANGSLNCTLHTTAFHEACKVLEFLCRGVDEHDASNDGGLADVDVRDENGWTALHFCAGVNCVEAVSVLASHGAELTLEANNGYTPFHWAQRLSNHDVANELQRLGADKRFLWLRHQPFSVFTNRIFSIAA